MIRFPIELQRLCLAFLRGDAYTLQALRATNKQLKPLASELLFECVVLNNEEKSGNKFQALAGSENASLVRCITINTSDDADEIDEKEDVVESFKDAVAMMHNFKGTEEVQLRFSDECAVNDDEWGKEVAETEEFRGTVLELLLPAIRQMANVKSLTIQNLQDSHDLLVYESEDFRVVRERISKLHLQIVTEYNDAAPEYNIDMPALHEGFSNALPNTWLKPMSHHLTHLSLYADCFWGIWPIVDLREIPPMTQLRSLSFGNFIFAHDWQVDWITAHSATLKALFLDDCGIVTSLTMKEEQARANFPDLEPLEEEPGFCLEPLGPPIRDPKYSIEVSLRWHNIFDRFRDNLSQLRRFEFGHGNWNSGEAFEARYELHNEMHEERYHSFEHGWGPSSWSSDDPPSCDDEDEETLDRLLETVRQRAAVEA